MEPNGEESLGQLLSSDFLSLVKDVKLEEGAGD